MCQNRLGFNKHTEFPVLGKKCLIDWAIFVNSAGLGNFSFLLFFSKNNKKSFKKKVKN